MTNRLTIFAVLFFVSPITMAAEKIQDIAIESAIRHYQQSKFFSKDIALEFKQAATSAVDGVILATESFKLRTSARVRKDKDDSALELKMKQRGVCNYVFSSVIAKMKERARELGANAIVNIASDFNDVESDDLSSYHCVKGAMLTAVSLKADFVKTGQ